MRPATRHLCLALLFALLIGHASVAVHAASHTAADIAECELCISYGDSSETLVAADGPGVPKALAEAAPAVDTPFAVSSGARPFTQRGPPILN